MSENIDKPNVIIYSQPDKLIDFPNKEYKGTSNESRDDFMETLFKELKDDMRERELRSERRFQEQQELLLSRVDDKLSEINSEINKSRAENRYWFIGIIIAFLTAASPIIVKLIEIFSENQTP